MCPIHRYQLLEDRVSGLVSSCEYCRGNYAPLPTLRHGIRCLFHRATSRPFPSSTAVFGFGLQYVYDISQLNGFLGSLPLSFWYCRIPVKYFFFHPLLRWVRRRSKCISFSSNLLWLSFCHRILRFQDVHSDFL